LKVCVLASSSSGNSVFVGTEHTRLLIDAGLSRKELATRLQAIGESPDALDAVLITHEHSDHVCGLIPLLKKHKLPVYVSWLTAPTMAWGDFEPRLESFMAGERFRIGDIEVDTFTIPHDAVDPV
jgi:phosphoribosyl 1,2-cyclic phosphodiesterase